MYTCIYMYVLRFLGIYRIWVFMCIIRCCYNVCLRVYVKMGTTGCVSTICPLNTIHVYDSLKTKICPPRLSSRLVHSQSHYLLLCVQSAANIKKTLVLWIVYNRHSNSPEFWLCTCTCTYHTDWNLGIMQKVLLNCFWGWKNGAIPWAWSNFQRDNSA